jgi:C-terminal processing protease CtpA/Prc
MAAQADTPASDNSTKPNAQAQNREQAHVYNLAISKLVAREKMTSDDFRNLQMGMTGFELFRPWNKKYAEVTEVFPGCPAEQAGLEIGDLIVSGDPSQNYKPKDTTKPIWAFTGGKAGSVVNLKVLRDGEIIPISITRMNIEDVPDAKIRKFYENMAEKLTESGEGIVEINKPRNSLLDSGR